MIRTGTAPWLLVALVACTDAATDAPSGERGFIELEPTAADPARGHMFYVLLPADADPEHAPLFVLWNGGPGFPTSLGLLVDQTGPSFVDDSGTVAPNPASFTAYGNLLYLDQRQTGFSYDDMPAATVAFDMVADAEEFTRALVRVLDAHPALRGARVVIVGESYGGVRAELVLDDLLDYSGHPALAAELQRHFDAVFPATSGLVHAPQEIAQQFFAQVLIQPIVMGAWQLDENHPPPRPRGFGCIYDVRLPFCTVLPPLAMIVDPAAEQALYGDRLDTTPGLAGPARHGFRSNSIAGDPDLVAFNDGLALRLGALDAGDTYLSYGPWSADYAADRTVVPDAFVQNLSYVRTLITNASYDGSLDTTAILRALVATGRPVIAGDGYFDVTLASGTVRVRMPTYAAGHMVTRTAAAALRADIADWLAR